MGTFDQLVQAELFGPIKQDVAYTPSWHEHHPVDDFSPMQTIMERWDYDKRIAEYIARAEQDGAFFLPETPQRAPRVGVAQVAPPLLVACAQVMPKSLSRASNRLAGRHQCREELSAFLAAPRC